MIRMINKLKNRKGFTLIELIVVLAVLAILMAIAVPRFIGVQDNAKIESDRSTLASIVKISELYLVKGDMVVGADATTPKTYTTTVLTGIIGADFPNGVEFQSTDSGVSGGTGSDLGSVTVSISDKGVVSAQVGTVKYPK